MGAGRKSGRDFVFGTCQFLEVPNVSPARHDYAVNLYRILGYGDEYQALQVMPQ